MKKQFRTKTMWGVLGLLVLLLAGCPRVYDFSSLEPYTGYQDANIKAINIPVALVISEKLKQEKIYNKLVGGSSTIILGKLLEKNSIELARSLFTTVVVKGTKKEAEASDAGAILMPTLVGSVQDLRQNQTTSAEMEWEFYNGDGQVIWVATVEGKGSAEVGFAFFNPVEAAEMRMKTQTTLLMQDSFNQSYSAIRNSPEIKAYIKEIEQ